MIKKLILFSILFSGIVFAQDLTSKFAEAMSEYNRGNFSRASEMFDEVTDESNLKEEIYASARFYKAQCLLNLEKIQAAAGEFESLIKDIPLSNFREAALYKLGTIYFETEDYSRSRRRLMELLDDYPGSEFEGSAYYWIGKAFIADNMYADAEEFLLEAVTERRNNQFVDYSIYTLAELYEKLEDFTNAVTYYDEMLAYYKNSELAPAAQLRIGICYFKLKEYDSAVIELSDPLINELPESKQAEAKYVLANSFFKLKEYDRAEKLFEQILNFDSDDETGMKVTYALAWVQFQMKDFDAAFRTFNRLSAEEADTLSSNSLFWSAECKRYAGDENSAMNIYDKFINKYPGHRLIPLAKYNIGVIYYNNKDIRRAERFLLSAVNSSDKIARARAYTMLGEISLDKKDFPSAQNYFEEAISLTPLPDDLSNRAILGLGISELYQKNYKDAQMNLTDLNVRAYRFENDKVNFYLAEVLFQLGNFGEAIKHFGRVSSGDTDLEKQALYGRAYSYYNLKDYANSAYYFREYIKKYRNDKRYSDAKMRLADSYYGTKNYNEASQIYREVFAEDKTLLNNDYSLYQYSQSLYRAGNSSAAIQNLIELQHNFPKSKYADNSQYLIGWIHFQQNEFSLAIVSYKNLIAEYPSSQLIPVGYYSIGDSYYNLGEYDSSLVYYNYLIQKFPQTKYVYDAINGIHYCYMAKGDPESSINLINDYVASNPRSEFADNILFKKGEIYYNLLNYQSAKISFKEFVATYPESELVPEAYYWIGKSSASLNQREEAEYYFGFLVEKYPKSEFSESAVLELGDLYTSEEDYESAVRLYDSAVNYLSGSKRIPEILFAKASAQFKSGNQAAAYNTYDEIITYYNQSIFAAKSKIELGILELNRGNYENAETLFRDLAESRTDDLGAQAQYYYGSVQFEKANYQEAIIAFVRVRSVFQQYDYWYNKSLIGLGDCYTKTGDKKKAREMYNAVIKKHSRDELGKEAKSKLRKL